MEPLPGEKCYDVKIYQVKGLGTYMAFRVDDALEMLKLTDKKAQTHEEKYPKAHSALGKTSQPPTS